MFDCMLSMAVFFCLVFSLRRKWDNPIFAGHRMFLIILVSYRIGETVGAKNILEKFTSLSTVIPTIIVWGFLILWMIHSIWRMSTTWPKKVEQTKQAGQPKQLVIRQVQPLESAGLHPNINFPDPGNN